MSQSSGELQSNVCGLSGWFLAAHDGITAPHLPFEGLKRVPHSLKPYEVPARTEEGDGLMRDVKPNHHF